MIRLNFTLPQELADEIADAAKDRGMTKSEFLRVAARALIENRVIDKSPKSSLSADDVKWDGQSDVCEHNGLQYQVYHDGGGAYIEKGPHYDRKKWYLPDVSEAQEG